MSGGWGVCLPVFVGFAKGEDDIFELGHEVFGGVVHELESTLVIWFRECMFLREAVSQDEPVRFVSPDHAPMKRVSVDTTDQETAWEERVWELKVADVGIL
jgi:hypothetical protein